MRTRYFTPDEANAQIPAVRPLMVQLRSAMRELRELAQVLNPEDPSVAPVLSEDLRAKGIERAEALRRLIQRLMSDVARLGAEVKDLDTGLVDFPALKSGQEVCLCWRLGENEIGHWHTTHEGFQGRKPLDGVAPAEWVWFS